MIRVADRLGMLPYIARERDRFADAVALRVAPRMSGLSCTERQDLMRSLADTVTGIVVVAIHRQPVPSSGAIARDAADAAWGIARTRLERMAELGEPSSDDEAGPGNPGRVA